MSMHSMCGTVPLHKNDIKKMYLYFKFIDIFLNTYLKLFVHYAK